MAERHEGGTRPFRVVVVGAGRIGITLALLLREEPGFALLLADPTEPGRDRARALALPFAEADPADPVALDRILEGADAVVAALPSQATPMVAAAARRHGCHYLDLGDDGAALEAVRREAAGAAGCFVAQCGISPGLVSGLVLDLAARFTQAPDIAVRIGGLPREPVGRLGYGLIWDVDATLREYTRASLALLDGREAELPPLSRLSPLRLGARDYEVFVSGAIPATLRQRLTGKVGDLVSYTIRYPGHAGQMAFLLDELKLRERVYLLRNLFLNALPEIADDRLLISITATPRQAEDAPAAHFLRAVEPVTIGVVVIGAMRRTAASHVAAVLDLLRQRRIGRPGLLAQEDIPLRLLQENRFLAWFFDPAAPAVPHALQETSR
ncbi:saccharopine dehydrogenase family protein [Bosea minatitlanensis]|uniref:Saccharopine dehydrogenase family protein n=1 Tax=Bosea minatitlanensis TaxID=128782 RepID=A0ABW0F4A5_9HYPH|nr:saccharopine dehydrogenase NADP-binding domain-containing protein [Bosea minatitlanensis]MCT4495627.1 saccharopine dehydrogenase NADP-binding domain-containing protein [Bosea minatitlanensis]